MSTVTLQVWRVPAGLVPAATVAARATARRLRRHRDVTFAKVLGTASADFLPTAATPTRWAALTCWRAGASPEPTSWWDGHAREATTLTLRVLASRGSWDRVAPFVPSPQPRWDGPVVALTRASLRVPQALRFYRAIPPIARALADADGCRAAFGIGEAPLLRQGTVSIWESPSAMREFAYATAAHVRAIDLTDTTGWYAEQLFAQFALVTATGSFPGAEVA